MKRSFQPAMAAVVLSGAMLQVFVPASAAVIVHDDGGTYDYPPLTAAGDDVEAYNATTVNLLTGGLIGLDLFAYNNSTVNVSGGTIGGDLMAKNNSKVTVSGGTITDDLAAYDDSTVTWSGGTVLSSLYANDDSTLTIIGTFDSFDYGDYLDDSSLDGESLTGTLLDGTPINNQVWINNRESSFATVTLQAIPEPSCFAVFGIGACGLVLVRRRRTATQRSPA